MVVLTYSVNMEKLKDVNNEVNTSMNIYVRKWRLLLVLNLTKKKENEEIEFKKNI